MDETADIEYIILNLKMISKIKQNNKLVIVNKTLHVDQRILQSVFRWYSADNRNDTIHFIAGIINQALEYTQKIENTVFDINTIKHELLSTITGLDHLSATYKLDNLIVSKIDILKEKINKTCVSSKNEK